MTTLRNGSRGEDVKILQTALNENGYDCGKVDGIFGANTEKAVRRAQGSGKLTVDGLAGKRTCKFLGCLEAVEVAQKASDEPIEIPCPNIKQQQQPHGGKVYGPNSSYSTYSEGGCGPTSICTIVKTYYDEKVSVEDIGKLCIKGGYRVKGGGTSGGAINYVLKQYGGKAKTLPARKSNIIKALKAGHLVILLIKKGFDNGYHKNSSKPGGHYIVLYGYKDGKFLLRDVGTTESRRQWATASTLPAGVKNAWECYKEA